MGMRRLCLISRPGRFPRWTGIGLIALISLSCLAALPASAMCLCDALCTAKACMPVPAAEPAANGCCGAPAAETLPEGPADCTLTCGCHAQVNPQPAALLHLQPPVLGGLQAIPPAPIGLPVPGDAREQAPERASPGARALPLLLCTFRC